MKTKKRIFTQFFLLLLVVTCGLLADASQDILPLGPSKYKFIIAKIEKDQFIRTATGQAVTLEEIVKQNLDSDVFIIGEAHDNYQCHTMQRDFIETLYKVYPKILVGFEFFWREDDPFLEQWRNSQISEEELIKKTGWYQRGGQNYGYTRVIMEILQKYKIKTLGLNVPRSILRTVSRQGFAQLSPEEKKLFPTIDIPNPQHEYFIKSLFGIFALQAPTWFENFYAAQKCWDVIMAESLRQTLAKKEFRGYKGVIIAGSNHVAFKLGIPFRYQKADKKVKITTIVPILLAEEKNEENQEEEEAHPMTKMMGHDSNPAALFSRGIADYVFAAYKPLRSHFPVIGFSIKEQDETLVVTRVSKGSIAEKNGIAKDDQITAVDGIPVSSEEQLRLLLSQKNWNDSVTFGIIKKIDIKEE